MYRVRIYGLLFARNESKERNNRRKHGISFTEAATAFNDPHAIRYFDTRHSEVGDRYLLLGLSTHG